MDNVALDKNDSAKIGVNILRKDIKKGDKMIKKVVLLLLLVTAGFMITSCAGNISLSIKKGETTNSKGERLEYFLGTKLEEELSNKLLVMIQGSGKESIAKRFDMGAEGTTLGFDILYLEKFGFDNEELFNKTDCRERRIQDIEFVVNHVIKDVYNNNLKEVLLYADSEGGSIAPEIANKIEEVTHLIIMGAGGYSQSKELEILLKKQIENEEKGIFEGSGIKSRDDLQKKFKAIKDNPTDEQFWLGHTYKYWDSYLDYKPAKYLSKLNIPVLYIIGGEDKSVPYQSVEYLADKFVDKRNFRFEIIPELDHSFTDKSGSNKIKQILKDIILPWYKKY